MEPTHLIFVRHGESLNNRGDVPAESNPGLTELGWRQSQAVADWLARVFQTNVLLSSGLMRARLTADLIGRRLGLPVQTQPGLDETESPYWEELPPAHQSTPFFFWNTTWLPTPEVAPTYSAFRERLRRALEAIMAEHCGKTIVVVTHGGTMGTIVRSLFGGHFMPVFTQNTGVTQVTWKDGHWMLVSHNLQEHLSPLIAPRNASGPDNSAPPFPWSRIADYQPVLDYYRRTTPSLPSVTAACQNSVGGLVAWAQVRPQTIALDVGCGAGALALALAPIAERVVGIDVSPAMLERAELARLAAGAANVSFSWAEAYDLPVPDRTIDLVAARNLWRHLAEPDLFVREAARVLRPTGRVLLDELIGSSDPVKRATQEAIEVRRNPTFLRLPTRSDLEQPLTAAGFRVEKAETYEFQRDAAEWLACSGADENTRVAVLSMLEAGMDTDATGLRVRRTREGGVTIVQQRLRLMAAPDARAVL